MIKLSSEKIFQVLLTRTRKLLQVNLKGLKVKFPESAYYFIFLPTTHALVDNDTKAQKKEEREKAAKADDPKAGADVGKIVNLMAGDCNRVRDINLSFFSRLPFFLSNFNALDISNGIFALFSLWRYVKNNSSFSELCQHGIHNSFSAPFEILIGGVFLYQSVGTLFQLFFKKNS